MSRQFKFRVWDKIENRWGNNAYLECCGSTLKHILYHDKPENYVIQQFTGLHDKNGKEIWEGDIIEPNYFYSGQPEKRYPNMVIEFNSGCFYLNEWWYSKLGLIRVSNSSHVLNGSYYITTGRVLGNIFENPELLK